MKKPNVAKLFNDAKNIASKHSPEILTGIGIAGMITTVVLAVKATPKAMELIEEERLSRYREENDEPINTIDTVKIAWKPYIPAVLTGSFAIACLIGANSVNAKRNAALATAYTISETALSEYKEKMIDVIGEKKTQAVKDAIAKENIEEKPVSKSEVIITGTGTTLCFDGVFGRYFESDIESIKRAINNINAKMLSEMYVSLNEFYDELDLDHVDIGDELGWNLDGGLVDVDFSSQITDTGRPCIVIKYTVAPKREYYRFA